MNQSIQSKISAVAESILNKIEERLNRADDKQISDEDLLILHSVFGVVLQRAFDVIEKHSTFVIYSTANKLKQLVEIKGENDKCYRIFPRINFCPCQAFKHQVLEKKIQLTCKHVLAARLQQMLGNTETHEITQDQYLMLLKSMFDL